MTLNQFRNILFPVLEYKIPKNCGKNENRFGSSFWADYGEIRLQTWYEAYSPIWNEKKKQYQGRNGKVTVRIGDEYEYFPENCTAEQVQNYINSHV